MSKKNYQLITLKDLFLKENNYIIEININKKYYLFIEGLNNYGCTNTCEDFNIEKIKTFCIELFDRKTKDYIETIDSYGITLNETIESLVTKTLKLIGG